MVCRRNQSSSVSRTRGQQVGTSPARMIFSGANRLARLAVTRPRSCQPARAGRGSGDRRRRRPRPGRPATGRRPSPAALGAAASCGRPQHRDGPADDPFGGDQLASSSGRGRRAGRPSGRPCRPAHDSPYRSGRRSRCPCRSPSGPPGRGSGDVPGRPPRSSSARVSARMFSSM